MDRKEAPSLIGGAYKFEVNDGYSIQRYYPK